MAESQSHKRAKSKAAGKTGATEKRIRGKRRVDAVTKTKATEIERSGSSKGLERAAKRLKDSGKSQRVLQVPEKDMKKAADAMRKVGVSGSIKNLSGTKRRSITSQKVATLPVAGLRKRTASKKKVRTRGTGSRKR